MAPYTIRAFPFDHYNDDFHWLPPYDHGLRPEKSTVLVELMVGDDYRLTRWDKDNGTASLGLEFGELQYEGGSAALENEVGFLGDAVASLLPEDITAGWWVLEGFYGSYYTDYWGEHDVDFEVDNVRPATWKDIEFFGMAKQPWWSKWLLIPAPLPFEMGLN